MAWYGNVEVTFISEKSQLLKGHWPQLRTTSVLSRSLIRSLHGFVGVVDELTKS